MKVLDPFEDFVSPPVPFCKVSVVGSSILNFKRAEALQSCHLVSCSLGSDELNRLIVSFLELVKTLLRKVKNCVNNLVSFLVAVLKDTEGMFVFTTAPQNFELHEELDAASVHQSIEQVLEILNIPEKSLDFGTHEVKVRIANVEFELDLEGGAEAAFLGKDLLRQTFMINIFELLKLSFELIQALLYKLYQELLYLEHSGTHLD